MSRLRNAGQHSLRAADACRVLMAGWVWAMAFGVFAAEPTRISERKEQKAQKEQRAPAPSQRVQTGIASVYAKSLDGKETASGEAHDSDDLTAAHRTLPLGTEVRVTNLATRQSVAVRVNDRGPAVKSRIIDLSPHAAALIGLRAKGKGITRVRVEIIRLAPAAEKESNLGSGATADNAAGKSKPKE